MVNKEDLKLVNKRTLRMAKIRLFLEFLDISKTSHKLTPIEESIFGLLAMDIEIKETFKKLKEGLEEELKDGKA